MPDNLEIRSEQIQELLTAVPSWMIRWGNSLLLALILGLLCITWFVKYPDIIASEAMITTQIPPQKEYARTTGEIETILVNDGGKVSKSDPLAVIKSSANFEDIFLLKSVMDTIVLNKKDFYFPLEDLPVLFLGEIDTDFALFENSYLQYKLNKQLQPHNNAEFASRISISEMGSRLRTLQAQRQLNKSELDFQKNNLDRHQALFDKGVISEQEYETNRLNYLQAERSYFNLDASISQLREAMSNANKASQDVSINRTKEEISLLKNVLQSFNQLKRAVKDWEARYVLSSNMMGRVSFLNVWNENQTVRQGDLVFTIIPEKGSSFVAKLKTPSRNSGKIHKGQTVRIKLENYPETEFGSIEGKVSSISMTPDQEGFYWVNVSLPLRLITSYEKEIIFKQEMRGTAEIITEDLRLIERFFYQLRDVLRN
ncbi:MAG: HlyD family efflux transporter periplasmic adaptor subunit [Bacteroidota bacterium]